MGLLQRGAVLEQDTRLGPLAHADHDRSRRGQPHGAGAGNDQHGDETQQRRHELRPGQQPDDERQQRQSDDRRHEPRRHAINHALDGGLAALGALHHADDLGQDAILADALGRDGQQPLPIERRADDGIAGGLVHWQALAGDHALVHRRTPLDDAAVHRDLLARPHAQHVAGHDFGHGYVQLYAIAHDAGRLRLQADELLDRLARPPLGPRLQQLAGNDEGDDDGRGLEVEVVAQGHAAGGLEQQHGHAIKIGHRRTESHQHVHVGAAVAQALERAGVVVPTDVELHRRGQQQEEPVHPQGIGPCAQQPQVAAHAQQEERQREDRAHQQPALLVGDLRLAGGGFGVGGFLAGGRLHHVVARPAHGGHQVGPRRGPRRKAHRGPLAGQIDRGVEHAVGLLQTPLDCRRAVGAGHAQQRQLDFGRGHVVAGAADARDNVGRYFGPADLLQVVADRHLLGGEVDRGVGHAFGLFGVALHRGHAVGAGHADDRQGQLLFTHKSAQCVALSGVRRTFLRPLRKCNAPQKVRCTGS